MKTPVVSRGLLAVTFFIAWGVATGAHAAVFRAYLSSTGNDANPCTLPAPCRLLPAALAAVQNNGEIWMLDSANYNTSTVTITKSVTILAVPGALGSVVATGGPAISITTASLAVALRNLVIVPLPPGGGDGVSMSGASTLTIEGSVIANLPGKGVNVIGAGIVTIINSIIRNNGNGVWAQDGAQVVVSASHVLGSTFGFGVLAYSQGSNTTKVTVSDTTLSGNTTALAVQGDTAGSDAQLFATRCTITKNSFGLTSLTVNAGASSLATISANMITNNSVDGIFAQGTLAKVKSLGNNHLADNKTDGAPTSTIALK